jgi:hypothetical protein
MVLVSTDLKNGESYWGLLLSWHEAGFFVISTVALNFEVVQFNVMMCHQFLVFFVGGGGWGLYTTFIVIFTVSAPVNITGTDKLHPKCPVCRIVFANKNIYA